MNKKELKAQMLKTINECKDSYYHYEPHFKELQMASAMKHNEKFLKKTSDLGKSSLYIPKLRPRVDRIIASLNEVYFSSERMAYIESYQSTDEENVIIKMWQEAIDLYTAKIPFFTIAQGFFQQACVLGTAIGKVYYNERKNIVNIEVCDIENIYFDSKAKSREDIKVIVEEQFMSLETIKEYIKGQVFERAEFKEDESILKERLSVFNLYQKKHDKWYLSTICKNKLLRQEVELKDGLPFVFGYMKRQERLIGSTTYNPAYGESPMSCILPLQKEMNITRNAMTDAINQSLNPKACVKRSSSISRDEIMSNSGLIYLSNQDDIRMLPAPPISPSMAQIQLIDNEISEGVGISAQNMGAVSSHKEQTATEISVQASEGGIRIGDYIRNFNETFFEPLFQLFADLVYKYADDDLFTYEGQAYKRNDKPSFKSIVQTGDGSTNKEVQKMGLQNAIQVVTQLAGMQANFGDQAGAKASLKKCEMLTNALLPLLVKNMVNFKSDDDEALQEEQALMEQQAMQEQALMEQQAMQEQALMEQQAMQEQALMEQEPQEEEEDTDKLRELIFNL